MVQIDKYMAKNIKSNLSSAKGRIVDSHRKYKKANENQNQSKTTLVTPNFLEKL